MSICNLFVPNSYDIFCNELTANQINFITETVENLTVTNTSHLNGPVTFGSTVVGLPLEKLSDVAITSPTSGQILEYNGTNWINSSGSGTDISLNDLSNVTITSPTSGQVLAFNGTNWINSGVQLYTYTATFNPAQIVNSNTSPLTSPLIVVPALGAGLCAQAISCFLNYSGNGIGYSFTTPPVIMSASQTGSAQLIISKYAFGTVNNLSISYANTIDNTDYAAQGNIAPNDNLVFFSPQANPSAGNGYVTITTTYIVYHV